MNYKADKSTTPLSDAPPAYRPYGAHLGRAISIVAGATLLIFLIFLSTGHVKLSHGGRQIVVVFIYSALIALPSIFLLTTLSFRFTDRFPRLVILMRAMVLMCTATVGVFASGLVMQLVGIVPRSAYWLELRSSLPFSIVMNLMFGLSISTFETLRYKFQAAQLELRTRQVEQERAYKLLAEARLSSLESRIHPHFLFNTLNSIAALIPSDPARAEQTVGNLASLLRFSLNANHSGLVLLSQELKVVREYLEIERTRFGARLRYAIDVPETLDEIGVPPLALQSLAENAVKHVVSKLPQGASLQITGSREGSRIRLAVLDDGPGFSLNAITPDHGLGNLIARMELLYGPSGQLEVARENDKTVVRLSFPA
jgi:sensor histidine kinase YesM